MKSPIGSPTSAPACCSVKVKAYKNLLVVGLSFLASHGPFIGMLNLQSSLNADQGLGLVSSATLYGIRLICTIFTPVFLKSLGTKYSLSIFGCGLYLVYILANYYPKWYTLIPGAAIVGLGSSVVWVGMPVHIIETAHQYAASLNKPPDHFVGLFIGIYTFFQKCTFLYGGLTSSIILFPFNPNVSEEDESVSSDNLSCSNIDADYAEQDILYYILVSVYSLTVVFGLVIALLMMDSYPTNMQFISCQKWCHNFVLQPLKYVLKLLLTCKMVLLVPLFVTAGLTNGFFFGSFSNVYISECVGIKWIGFTLATTGISSGLTSLAIGRLYNYIPTYVILYTGTGVAIGASFFIIFWERVPSFIVIFMFAIGWGLVGSTFNTLSGILVGVLCPDKREAGYSIYIMFFAAGLIIIFILPLYANLMIQMSVYILAVTTTALTVTIALVKTSKKCVSNEQTTINE